MKPFYNRERKKWGLHSSPYPRKGTPISGTVLVSTEKESGYAYIWFNDAFVEAVGKAMPMGIGKERPVYLCYWQVPDWQGKGCLSAIAFSEDSYVPLVEYEGEPFWLGPVHRRVS
jgi:hypothetical protein